MSFGLQYLFITLENASEACWLGIGVRGIGGDIAVVVIIESGIGDAIGIRIRRDALLLEYHSWRPIYN